MPLLFVVDKVMHIDGPLRAPPPDVPKRLRRLAKSKTVIVTYDERGKPDYASAKVECVVFAEQSDLIPFGPLRFGAQKTRTHDAASLVFPPATTEHPNGAPGPADTAALFVPRDESGEPDYTSATVTDYRRGTP